MHAEATPADLKPTDRLHLPRHRAMVVQYGAGEAGQRVLQLFHGEQEISFDEPELFAFGETLARQACFAAGDALGWGQPGPWPRVQSLLLQLVDAGVLQRAVSEPIEPRVAPEAGRRPSPLPPARSEQARSWHEGPALMAEVVGRPLDPAWLELVVPIFRVAHMALDGDGRQVGEANVFPPRLRLAVPTVWRTCIYPGSRHLHDKPMNVTALKAMRAHWQPMMTLLLQVREAYLRRCPAARAGWTVGHLERMATAVLALPAYQLMRAKGRVGSGELHPVLSSLFRVTDGLRMVLHHMLFIPFGEATRRPDSPVTAAEVHAYAERAFSFIADHGVCAGPAAMIDEFLAVAIDGQRPRGGLPEQRDPAVEAACDDIEPALDYAMRGLMAFAAVFSLWPATMRAYEELAALAEAWALQEPLPAVLAWRDRLRPIVTQLRSSTHLATEAWRADRERVYGDMFAQCHQALHGAAPARSLAEHLQPAPALAGEAQAWQAAVAAAFGPAAAGAPAAPRAALATLLSDYTRRAQAVVRTACAVQRETVQALGRAPASRPFEAADIDLYVQLSEETAGRVPFLLDELPRWLGVRVVIGEDRLEIQPATGLPGGPPESADIGSADPRASSTQTLRSKS